jgi:hypothetical protein
MTAQLLAGRNNGDSAQRLYTTKKLIEELHHPHALHRAAAVDAARWLMALALDRFTFFEGTRAEVWGTIFDGDRLQADIDRGDPRRTPRDPMRAAGAQLVVDALKRLVALRASAQCAVELPTQPVSRDDLARILAELAAWTCADEEAIDDAA